MLESCGYKLIFRHVTTHARVDTQEKSAETRVLCTYMSSKLILTDAYTRVALTCIKVINYLPPSTIGNMAIECEMSNL